MRIYFGQWNCWEWLTLNNYLTLLYSVLGRALPCEPAKSIEPSGGCHLTPSLSSCVTQTEIYFSDTQKHRKIEAKTVDLYGSANTERCPLQAIICYLSLLPKKRLCMAFYLQPRKKFFGKAWYVNHPAGINRLCTAVGLMCQ